MHLYKYIGQKTLEAALRKKSTALAGSGGAPYFPARSVTESAQDAICKHVYIYI